jgi:cyclase
MSQRSKRVLLPRRSRARSSVHVGEREVRLIAVGPAHTAGDAIAYVPDAAAVFTGDILFAASTPVMWAGPVSSWIAAADLVLSLEPSGIVYRTRKIILIRCRTGRTHSEER